MKTITFKTIFAAGLLAAICITADAQKLPNVQQTGVYAPANVKIDGKATEWDNKFQAYNNATDIFYTIANNDDYLYLIVQATDANVIRKIVERGVTLTIKKSKNLMGDMSFTFPINNDTRGMSLNLNTRMNLMRRTPEDTSARALDSIMMHNNKTLGEKHKWIQVTGVKDVDSLISVYNDQGIKAVGSFNTKKAYTFEMSVKLKLLGLSTSDATKFSYQLKVNGARSAGPITTIINGDRLSADEVAQVLADANAKMNSINGPTYFNGEYTLAKK